MTEKNDKCEQNPPAKTWRIEVFRDLERIFQYDVPMHRLEDKSVFSVLRTIVLKYEDLVGAELVNALLNKRRGGPVGITIEKSRQETNIDKKRIGYTVFGPSITAIAYWTMPENVENFLRSQVYRR